MRTKHSLQKEFEKVDAEHTALTEKLQESANRRQALLRQLTEPEAVEAAEEVIEETPPAPEPSDGE